MPGISLVCDLTGNMKQKESEVLQSLKSLIYAEHYKQEVLHCNDFCFLGCTRYDEYPVTSFENDDYYIFLEGRIYDKDHPTVTAELFNLARQIFQNRDGAGEKLAAWLLNTDGDFIVFMLDKHSNDVAVINDALGRLPLYYYNANGTLIVSRELRFVANLINDTRPDTMAIAQYLLFGYPLGKRTLLKNVSYLNQAALIKINFRRPEVNITNVHPFNFDNKEYKNRTLEQNAGELASIFCEACKNRNIQSNKNVLALSGGLDSRSVAIGLRKTKTPFFASTRLSFDKRERLDAKIAEQFAHKFDVDWKLLNTLPPIRGKDYLKLLKIKSGLNYLGMSFIFSFLDKIKDVYGSQVTYFTGDMGDGIKPNPGPPRKLKTLDQLVNYIIYQNHIFPLARVAALTQIPKNEIIDEIRQRVLSYPEKDWNQKYVHFIIYETFLRCVFEGEDRNRYYFWCVAPFSSIRFFNYAMNCPQSMKAKYKLYHEFLLKLSPRVLTLDNADWRMPITSNAVKFYFFAKYICYLPSKLRLIVKAILEDAMNLQERDLEIVNCFWDQIENCEAITNYLSIKAIKKIKNLSKCEFDTLFTITSSIEEFECGKSTIEKYYESFFK